MKITWYGHSCFLLETSEFSVVFDPYSPGSVPGLSLPEIEADAVFCSHGHGDHAYADGVRLSGRSIDSSAVTQVSTFHDECGGTKRGTNLCTVIEADGIRVCHLGDLGHPLSAEQLAALGRVDVLLIPVGGFYTIDAETADAVRKALSPAVTVPMHYRGAGFGYDVIGTVDAFTALSGNVRRLSSNVLELGSLPEAPETVVLSLS